MILPYNGECLCGAVRLSISSEPQAVLSCFCQHCSKGAGGTHQIIAKFVAGDVNVSADKDCLTIYKLQETSSGLEKEKVFCKVCGVPLWTVPASAKGKFLLIRAAILERAAEFKPTNEIFTKYRPKWVKGTDGSAQWAEARK